MKLYHLLLLIGISPIASYSIYQPEPEDLLFNHGIISNSYGNFFCNLKGCSNKIHYDEVSQKWRIGHPEDYSTSKPKHQCATETISYKIMKGFLAACRSKGRHHLSYPIESDGTCHRAYPPFIHFDRTSTPGDDVIKLETTIWAQTDDFFDPNAQLHHEKELLAAEIINAQRNSQMDALTQCRAAHTYLNDQQRATMTCKTVMPKTMMQAILNESQAMGIPNESPSAAFAQAYFKTCAQEKKEPTEDGNDIYQKPFWFKHVAENDIHIIETKLNGSGPGKDNLASNTLSSHDKVKNEILNAALNNEGKSIYKLDAHTKCNAPVFWGQNRNNWWIMCHTFLTAKEFNDLKNVYAKI